MAVWELVPCLRTLRGEFDQVSPARDRTSDGSIGNAAHAAESSDHNPDETGVTPYEDGDDRNEVHAIDVDDTGPWPDPEWFDRKIRAIVEAHRLGHDDRLQNVIRNGRIASRTWGWEWRTYNGRNPHDKHAHFSARYTAWTESDTSPWGVADMASLDNADVDVILARDNVPNPYGDAATNPKITVANALKAAAAADRQTRDVPAMAERLETMETELAEMRTTLSQILAAVTE